MGYSTLSFCPHCRYPFDFGYSGGLPDSFKIGKRDHRICPKCNGRIATQIEWDYLTAAQKVDAIFTRTWRPLVVAVWVPLGYFVGWWWLAAICLIISVWMAVDSVREINASKKRTRAKPE